MAIKWVQIFFMHWINLFDAAASRNREQEAEEELFELIILVSEWDNENQNL